VKTRIHLVLISAQAVPNITPILDERFRPQQVIMLVSDDMQERSTYLENIYKPRGVKVSRWRIDDPWDVEHIRNQVMELLAEYDDADIVLNATCGTKPMSIAAYEVFRALEKPIFYIHPEQDRLIWMHPQKPSIDLEDRIKLKEYLLAYGASTVKVLHQGGVTPKLRELTGELIDNIQSYAAALSSLNYYASAADNKNLQSPEISRNLNGNHRFWDMLDLFEQAELLHQEDRSLIFTDENARFIVNGGWLELYAYACCLNVKKKLRIQDVGRSVEVGRYDGRNSVLNEIDVAFLQDNGLYLLECKTKRYSGTSKKHSEVADVLYKLDSIRDVLGGLQAKAMLVSIKKLEQHDLARARELKIEVCCHQELKYLEEKLQEWLKN
jgi:Card1-like endonuclease family protein